MVPVPQIGGASLGVWLVEKRVILVVPDRQSRGRFMEGMAVETIQVSAFPSGHMALDHRVARRVFEAGNLVETVMRKIVQVVAGGPQKTP